VTSIDDDLQAMLGWLDVDVDDAVVLYANDFTATTTQGRSGGPAGRGPCAADIDVLVPFHYRVVVDTLDDGTRAVRFPTGREQPGGGPGYSWFAPLVRGRGALLRAPTAWGFTVIVPRPFDNTVACAYHENRFVLSVGRENVENLGGLRFDGPDELVWVRGGNGRGYRSEVLDRLPLGSRLVGGEQLRFTVGVDVGAGRLLASVRCGPRGIDTGSAVPIALDLARADCIVVSASGNSLSSDDDANWFFRLADVVVVGRRR
jgi:hypothetical protein